MDKFNLINTYTYKDQDTNKIQIENINIPIECFTGVIPNIFLRKEFVIHFIITYLNIQKANGKLYIKNLDLRENVDYEIDEITEEEIKTNIYNSEFRLYIKQKYFKNIYKLILNAMPNDTNIEEELLLKQEELLLKQAKVQKENIKFNINNILKLNSWTRIMPIYQALGLSRSPRGMKTEKLLVKKELIKLEEEGKIISRKNGKTFEYKLKQFYKR